MLSSAFMNHSACKIFSKGILTKPFLNVQIKIPVSKVHNYKVFPKNLLKSFRFFNQNLTTATIPGSFPAISPKASKYVGSWLICCSGMVIGSVVLGGITRLTKSGLSMVDWHLFKEFPPLTQEQWQLEFEKYKQYPEYKQNNANMTVDEFKWIWFMEYGHRMWGRAVGAVFLFPAIYFWRKNWFAAAMKKRVLIFGSLILCQGLLGWYMVKSGLEEKPEPDGVARVSQYRLAAHLGMAFAVYSLMLWSGLSLLLPPQPMQVTKSLLTFRKFAHGAKGLIFLTAFSDAILQNVPYGTIKASIDTMAQIRSGWSGVLNIPLIQSLWITFSVFFFYNIQIMEDGLLSFNSSSCSNDDDIVGAFVAGIEAGLVYNTFPKMADRWIPSDIGALTPKWKNITENPTTTQFNHRILGELVFCIVTALWLKSRKLPLSPRSRLAMNCMFAMALIQVGLGITTLLTHVPKPLAATHQSGALALLSTAIWLSHELRVLKLVPK